MTSFSDQTRVCQLSTAFWAKRRFLRHLTFPSSQTRRVTRFSRWSVWAARKTTLPSLSQTEIFMPRMLSPRRLFTTSACFQMMCQPTFLKSDRPSYCFQAKVETTSRSKRICLSSTWMISTTTLWTWFWMCLNTTSFSDFASCCAIDITWVSVLAVTWCQFAPNIQKCISTDLTWSLFELKTP